LRSTGRAGTEKDELALKLLRCWKSKLGDALSLDDIVMEYDGHVEERDALGKFRCRRKVHVVDEAVVFKGVS
jgi:hypothetical protein